MLTAAETYREMAGTAHPRVCANDQDNRVKTCPRRPRLTVDVCRRIPCVLDRQRGESYRVPNGMLARIKLAVQ
jgi:hypothetical protein